MDDKIRGRLFSHLHDLYMQRVLCKKQTQPNKKNKPYIRKQNHINSKKTHKLRMI